MKHIRHQLLFLLGILIIFSLISPADSTPYGYNYLEETTLSNGGNGSSNYSTYAEIWITDQGDMDNVPDLYPTLDGRYLFRGGDELDGDYNISQSGSLRFTATNGENNYSIHPNTQGDMIFNISRGEKLLSAFQISSYIQLVQRTISNTVVGIPHLSGEAITGVIDNHAISLGNDVYIGDPTDTNNGRLIITGSDPADQLIATVSQSLGLFTATNGFSFLTTGVNNITFQGAGGNAVFKALNVFVPELIFTDTNGVTRRAVIKENGIGSLVLNSTGAVNQTIIDMDLETTGEIRGDEYLLSYGLVSAVGGSGQYLNKHAVPTSATIGDVALNNGSVIGVSISHSASAIGAGCTGTFCQGSCQARINGVNSANATTTVLQGSSPGYHSAFRNIPRGEVNFSTGDIISGFAGRRELLTTWTMTNTICDLEVVYDE